MFDRPLQFAADVVAVADASMAYDSVQLQQQQTLPATRQMLTTMTNRRILSATWTMSSVVVLVIAVVVAVELAVSLCPFR